MAKPNKSHVEMILWTAVLTAVVSVLVERTLNRGIETKDRLGHPARRLIPRNTNNLGGEW